MNGDMSLSQPLTATWPARLVLGRLSAPLALGGLVLTSVVIRTAATITHAFPQYFPDEYIYSSLARSLAAGRGLTIRGGPAHFPALLEPLLSAPLWLVGNPETAYHLVLVWHTLAMSLAAVPVYVLCRRLALPTPTSLGAAAFSIALPSFAWASVLTADAIGYTLALATVAAFVATLERPTMRLQVLTVLLSGATTLARVQYVVLPLIFVVGCIVIERGCIRQVLRRFPVAIGLFAVPLIAGVAAGPSRIFGYYQGVLHLAVQPTAIGRWIAIDVVLLAVSAGVVLVPAAVTGICRALIRPSNRAEAGFAIVTALFALALLLEAGLYASNGSNRFQERYLMALPPLAAPAFALGLRRMSRHARWMTGAVAAAILIVAVRMPLSGYAADSGKQDSPFLHAVSQLEQWTSTSTGSLLMAVMTSALAVAAFALTLLRRGALVGLLAACLVAAGTTVAATALANTTSDRARLTYAPEGSRWVDEAGVGPADLLVLPGTPPAVPPMHLFWNTSLKDVLLLPGAVRPDAFRLFRLRVSSDGILLANRRPIRRPLLVEEYLGRASFQHARRIRTTLTASIWRPDGEAQLAWLARGRYYDGWLASRSSITIWPDQSARVRGTLRLRLYLPKGIRSGSLRLAAPGIDRIVSVPSGGVKTIDVPVHSDSSWTLNLESTTLRFLSDGRNVSVKAAAPVFERAPLKTGSAAADRS
jgi:hypothetical protein